MRTSAFRVLIAGCAAILVACQSASTRQHASDPSIVIGERDLGGIVASANGPEAGVSVIAETNDLPTKFAKIVVTDERGRYVLPDLPPATYEVWVRGYGLIDSPQTRAQPGWLLDLEAVVALTRAAAAEYYPAAYWYSMLTVPSPDRFSASGKGGIDKVRSQTEWL